MEEKVVCYYCGTIYDPEEKKCPLCGSTRHAEQAVIPQRRERLTERERRQRRSKGGKYSAKAASKLKSKPVMIAALVFLTLAVLVLLWFIGDMIGWWPGLEDTVERETQANVVVNDSCTELIAEPTKLDFNGVGAQLKLRISVNVGSNDTLYCTSADPSIVSISETGETEEGEEYKSVTFTLTALAEGETEISITCGKQTATCPVTVGDAEPIETTPTGIDPNYIPELNRMEVTFEEKEATVTLKVTNLPASASVIWRSADESIATVDANGVVTAVGSGETRITAEVNGSTIDAIVKCSFADVGDNDGAHLERTDVTVSVGESFPLYLYNSDSEHIDDIYYIIDDESICKVEDNYVTALDYGTTTVTVVYNGVQYTCIVRVTG